MENLKIRHLLVILVTVIVVTVCANHCTGPAPAWGLYQNRTGQRWLMWERQNAADLTVLQVEKAYERMSDKRRMKGVVYKN